MAREVYRIIRAEVPTRDDFLTSRELGKTLRNPARRREWSEAISVYDDVGYAVEQARYFGFKLGRYLLRISIPDGELVELVPTGPDPRHLSLFATIDQLVAWADEAATVDAMDWHP